MKESTSASTSLRLFFFAGLFLSIHFLFIHQFAFAQGASTGDLHVTVKDPKGSVVANATVTVRDTAKGLERVGSGDGAGGYSVRQLAPAFIRSAWSRRASPERKKPASSSPLADWRNYPSR